MIVWSPASSVISWRVSMICFGIEAGRRLVEDQHVGVVDERLRQADALPVALRELAAVAVGHVGDARPLHHRVDARRRARRPGTPLMLRDEVEVLAHVMSG